MHKKSSAHLSAPTHRVGDVFGGCFLGCDHFGGRGPGQGRFCHASEPSRVSVADCRRRTRRPRAQQSERFALSSHAAVIIRCCHFSDNENTLICVRVVCLHSLCGGGGDLRWVRAAALFTASASVFQNSHLFFLPQFRIRHRHPLQVMWRPRRRRLL
jgi:hypothetical protein